MYLLNYLIFVPQILALIHYFRNRPEGYWFWIILFFGPLGAIIYFIAVVLSGSTGSLEGKIDSGMRQRRRLNTLKAKVAAGDALPYDYSDLGELYFHFRKFSDAANVLEEAVKRAPENKDARYFLGLSLEKLGRFEDAGRHLEPLIMEDPKFKFGEAMLCLARCYKGAGVSKAAIGAYKKVLSQSDFAEARYSLAELLIQKGDKQEAKEQLERLIKDAMTADLPAFQRRQEKKWMRKAKALLSTLS